MIRRQCQKHSVRILSPEVEGRCQQRRSGVAESGLGEDLGRDADRFQLPPNGWYMLFGDADYGLAVSRRAMPLDRRLEEGRRYVRANALELLGISARESGHSRVPMPLHI